jgi:hypothetical protein
MSKEEKRAKLILLRYYGVLLLKYRLDLAILNAKIKDTNARIMELSK